MKKISLIPVLLLFFGFTYTYDFESTTIGNEADQGLFNASSNVISSNTHVKNGSKAARCYFPQADYCFGTSGLIDYSDIAVTDGVTETWGGLWVYFGEAADNPSGLDFDFTNYDGGVEVQKFYRFRKHTSGDAHRGYNSLYIWSRKPTVDTEVPYITNPAHIPPDFHFDRGVWHYVEFYCKYSSTSSGNVSMWVDGVLKQSVDGANMTSDVAKLVYTYIFSWWNNRCPENQYAWIDDVYISTDARSPVYTGGGSDTTAPTISNQDPSDTESGVSITKDPFINFDLNDSESGVDQSSIRVTVEGVDETEDLAFGGDVSTTSVYLTLSNINASLTNSQVINVDVGCSDLAANTMVTESYSFTIEALSATGVFAAGDTGDRSNYTELNSSRWQTVDESGDILYQINDTSFGPIGDGALGEVTVFNGSTYSEFEIQAEARSDENLVSNTYADYAIVFGYEDANNYYYAMYNSDSISTEIFQVVNDVRSTLGSYAGSIITDNNFHTVKVVYQNGDIKMYYDGALLITVSDSQVPTGKVGFGGYNDYSSWDDIVITDLVESPTQDPVVPSGKYYFTLNGATWK